MIRFAEAFSFSGLSDVDVSSTENFILDIRLDNDIRFDCT